MGATEPEVADFVDRLSTEYNDKVERMLDEHLDEEYYDSIGGPEEVIRTQFPPQAWREFYIGLFPPSRQVAMIYETGEPYGRDRDIMVGLGKQVRDEIKHANIFTQFAGQFGVDCDMATWEGDNYEKQVAVCRNAADWDTPQAIAAGFQCSSEIVAAVHSKNMADYLEDDYPRIARSLRDIASDEGDHMHVGRLIMKRFASPDEFDELEAIAQQKYEALEDAYSSL